MRTVRRAQRNRPLWRSTAALAVLGGAGTLAFASPAAAHVAPALTAAISNPFNVFLVLPASSGAAGSKTAATMEQLSAFSLSTTAPTTGAIVTQAVATMPIDSVSTGLLRDVLVPQHLDPVQVLFRRAASSKQATFLTYTFRNVTLTNYQLQNTSGGASVQVTLGFQSIALSFGTGATSATGAVGTPGGFDITTNKAS